MGGETSSLEDTLLSLLAPNFRVALARNGAEAGDAVAQNNLGSFYLQGVATAGLA